MGQSSFRDSTFILIVNLPEAKGGKQQKIRRVGRKEKKKRDQNKFGQG